MCATGVLLLLLHDTALLLEQCSSNRASHEQMLHENHSTTLRPRLISLPPRAIARALRRPSRDIRPARLSRYLAHLSPNQREIDSDAASALFTVALGSGGAVKPHNKPRYYWGDRRPLAASCAAGRAVRVARCRGGFVVFSNEDIVRYATVAVGRDVTAIRHNAVPCGNDVTATTAPPPAPTRPPPPVDAGAAGTLSGGRRRVN
ncbi:hypothetical protein EVAR_41973_1 [Eumeta japonica]|uniref:Uncharacterized protein n=1 Tax=Eumeta variegata TaxID=151549 RepID=A0A4C1WTW4_EUMVA|nr:hypothetical protein EVAR_41973_1 [Eumeta japonica]